jgi:hypothetical protein
VAVKGNDHNEFRLHENTTRPTNRIEKMEDENQTNDTSEETVERKDNTNFTV